MRLTKEIMIERASEQQETIKIKDRWFNKTPRKYDNRLFIKHNNRVYEIQPYQDIYEFKADVTNKSVNGTGIVGHELFW